MTFVSGGGFLPSDNLSNIISSNFQELISAFLILLSLLNFYLVFNIFNKRVLSKNHNEDLYLVLISVILILIAFVNDIDSFNLIFAVLSSLANSGLTYIETETNLTLYFLLITLIGGSLISNTSGIKLANSIYF